MNPGRRPCDNCSHFSACRRLAIACRVFYWWVVGNNARRRSATPENWEPSKREYLRMMGAENDD